MRIVRFCKLLVLSAATLALCGSCATLFPHRRHPHPPHHSPPPPPPGHKPHHKPHGKPPRRHHPGPYGPMSSLSPDKTNRPQVFVLCNAWTDRRTAG